MTDTLVFPPDEWDLVRSAHRILRNVGAPAYAAPMGSFPVDPADVPDAAVNVMQRTLLHHADAIAADPLDEETARTITWVLMNWLAGRAAREGAVTAGPAQP